MRLLIIPEVIWPSIEPSFVINDDEEEDDQDWILEAAKRYDWEFPIDFQSHTLCHRAPADTPAILCTSGVGFEEQVDDIAGACHVGRQSGATRLLFQGCPVPICDCQVVVGTLGMGLDVEGSEL